MCDKQYKAPINFSWIIPTLEICSTFLIFKFSFNFFSFASNSSFFSQAQETYLIKYSGEEGIITNLGSDTMLQVLK